MSLKFSLFKQRSLRYEFYCRFCLGWRLQIPCWPKPFGSRCLSFCRFKLAHGWEKTADSFGAKYEDLKNRSHTWFAWQLEPSLHRLLLSVNNLWSRRRRQIFFNFAIKLYIRKDQRRYKEETALFTSLITAFSFLRNTSKSKGYYIVVDDRPNGI